LPYLLQLPQSLTVLAAAPLYARVLTKAPALLQSKHGPSILQP
jgi:formate hydrogenlyase subunit 4